MNTKLLTLFTIFILHVSSSYGHNFSIKEGYAAELITGDLINPTAIQIAPDGRIFISEKSGTIRIMENGVLLQTPFLDLDVDEYGERGLSGFLLDKDFDNTGHVFVYYNVIGQNHNRLSRFTSNGNTVIPGSEKILLDLDPLNGTTHNSGAMRWALDTTLLVSVGDGLYTEKPQKLDNLFGKILRLNRDGSAPTDNPFYNTAEGNGKLIYALGLRNPFTMDINPKTGRLFANDVGDQAYEEINDITTGSNYGWPIIEGPIIDQSAPDNYKDPIFTYDHENGYCAVVGGAFYSPESSTYPPEWMDKYFFSDFCTGNVHRLNPETGIIEDTLIFGAHNISSLYVSKNGYLYYSIFGYGPSQVYRVSYVGNGTPFITAQPRTEMVSVGENIEMKIEITGDETLNYQWFKNDSPISSGNSANLILENVMLSDSGSTVYCKVSNSLGEVISDTITLLVTSNKRPIISILEPTTGTNYEYGDSLYFEGSALDPEDGTLNSNQLEWTIFFHHDDHSHPGLPSTSGISKGAIYLPRVGETSTNVWYRIHLKGTDSKGLSSSKYVDIHPITSSIDLKTIPTGLTIALDGSPKTTNYSFNIVNGNQRVLTAEEYTYRNDSLFKFSNWSNDSTDNNLTFLGGDFDKITAHYSYVGKYIQGEGDGLTFTFYENINFTEPSLMTRIDPVIDYQLDYGSFGWGMKNDSISVTWEGSILAPVDGEYKFTFEFDDWLDVSFDNEEKFDRNWGGEESFTVDLNAGEQYNIQLNYQEVQWIATIKMFWEHPYQSKQIVPQEFLYSKYDPNITLDPNKIENLEIFPNPGLTQIHIYYPDSQPSEVKLFDIKGNLIQEKKLTEEEYKNTFFTMNISKLSQGMYFFQIKSKDKIHSGKFLKK